LTHHCYIDGSNFIHRAWHVAAPRHRKADGMDFGATWLFASMLMRLVEQMQKGRKPPTHMAIFFDPGRTSTWRSKVFPEYKAGRPETPAELKAQIPVMMAACEQIGIPWCLAEGYEADDLLAAYVEDAKSDDGLVSILSGDKDLMQLVDKKVLQYDDKSKRWFKQQDVEEKFGVPCNLVADFLAMAGDSADGIPGVRGIGPKYAVQLLMKYGSLQAMLDDPSIIEEASLRKKIEANLEEARMSRRLTVLTGEGIPRPIPMDDLARGPDIDMRGRTVDWLNAKTN
jgi:DNA polymerase I